MNALLATLRYARDPYGTLVAAARRGGDVFRLPFVTGAITVLGHPDGARAVFQAPPETFAIWSLTELVPIFGARSIFCLTGDAHRRVRRAVVAGLAAATDREAIARRVGRAVAALPTGRDVDLTRWLGDLARDVILETLFGDPPPAAARDFVAAARAPSLPATLLLPAPLRGLAPAYRRFRAADAALRRAIGRQALAGELFRAGLDAGEVGDNIATLIIAGHETTAHATAWAIDSLARTPRAVAAMGDPAYLDAVCEETLRLHPVVVPVTRVLARELAACGRTLPAGTVVSPSSCVIHRRPDVFEGPDEFRPERFLARPPSPFEHLPFGGGVTRCVGAEYGKGEMKLILAALFDRFSVEPRARRPPRAVLRGLTMVPERPVVVRLRRR